MISYRVGFGEYKPRFIERVPNQETKDRDGNTWIIKSYWRVWLTTADYVHGTYLALYDDGSVFRVTVRPGEGDDIWMVKPGDADVSHNTRGLDVNLYDGARMK